MDAKMIDFLKKGQKLGLIVDAANPLFVFQLTSAELLAAMLAGKYDVTELIKLELSNRGLDEKGVWKGFAKNKTSPEKIEASKKSRAKKAAAKKVAEPAKADANAK